MKSLVLKIIKVSVGFVALCLGLAWLIAGDPVSQRKWSRIHPGMTKDQVIAILGQPTSDDGNNLFYSGLLNAGYVQFIFSDKELLLEKNDESVFRSLR